jgi:hypothetical protein
VSAGTLRLTLAARAIGYGHSLRHVTPVVPDAVASGATYARAGLVEWYRSRPAGLEQGFTVARPPARAARGPLTLEISLSGNAAARASADRRSLTFAHTGAPPLRYGGLRAVDGRGRELPSRLELRGDLALLRVDVRRATYPLRIDPLVSLGSRLTDGQPLRPTFFGSSAALSADGGTALVGAPRGNGSAWILQRSAATWQLGQVLEGPKEKEVSEIGFPCPEEPGGEQGEEDSGCGFGASVAISADGSTALVGSPRERRTCPTETTCPFQGAAWVFTRAGETWILQAVLLGGGEEGPGGRFGRSVALSADGNTALVGAPADEGSTGAVWAFTRSGSSWTQQGPKLTAAGEVGAGRFGYALALSSDGNSALIGAPSDAAYTGAAWSFARSGATWTRGQQLTGPGELGPAHFGASVALSASAETALVGGFRDNGERGAAWSFARSGASWTFAEKLTGRAEKEGAWFGFSVALSGAGDLALVGGPKEENRRGVTWAFTRAGAGWGAFSQKLSAGVEAPDKPRFGHSVAVSSDGLTVFVGGPRDEDVAGAVWPFGHAQEVEAPPKKEVEEAEREEENERAVVPEVTGVEPNQGPSGGGTPLTIIGHHLLETQVEFGLGSKVRVFASAATEQSISVITPGHAAGPVDVVAVKLRGGAKSATTPSDVFTFVAPQAQIQGPPEESTLGGAGVLSYGPAALPASCRPSLVAHNLAVTSKGSASLKLLLQGTGTCRARLVLSVKQKLAHHRTRTRTIAAGTFSLISGRTAALTLKVNALGRGLLRAGHGPLSASLSIVRLSPGPPLARTASVRLALKSSHR